MKGPESPELLPAVATEALTTWRPFPGRARWRLGCVLASVLFHAAAVILFGFTVAKLQVAEPAHEQPVVVSVPLEFSRRETTRRTETSVVSRERTRRAPTSRAPPEDLTNSAPPSAMAPSQAPKTTTGGEGNGASAPEASAGVGDALRAALRARVGCDAADVTHLSQAERARCDQTAGAIAKLATPFDTIPPEKRAYYDAVQAAYQASRRPDASAYVDANGNIAQWGHPPGVGCTFRRKFRPGASLSDKIKATGMIGVPLGPLSCGLALPQGSLTPEIGIPTP